MLLEDKGKPTKYSSLRLNYDIVIDNEKFTLKKLAHHLGFYTILFQEKIKEAEIIYDTDKKLLTGSGLIIRKKLSPKRAYFSLVRISSMNNLANREKKDFLGECEPNDQPSDFPVQIADAINKIFNNLFTINVVDIVKHCTPYIRMDVGGNRYRLLSGTGYEVSLAFENLKVRDVRSGKKAKTRIFSLKMELDPNYEKEREQILNAIERWCKELVPTQRQRFEIAEVLVKPKVPKVKEEEKKVEDEEEGEI